MVFLERLGNGNRTRPARRPKRRLTALRRRNPLLPRDQGAPLLSSSVAFAPRASSCRGQPAVAMVICGHAGCRVAGRIARDPAVRDAFKAMPVKTDRKDARGIAQLMRLGWFVRCTASRRRRKKYGRC